MSVQQTRIGAFIDRIAAGPIAVIIVSVMITIIVGVALVGYFGTPSPTESEFAKAILNSLWPLTVIFIVFLFVEDL